MEYPAEVGFSLYNLVVFEPRRVNSRLLGKRVSFRHHRRYPSGANVVKNYSLIKKAMNFQENMLKFYVIHNIINF